MGEIISAALPGLFEAGSDFFAGGGGEALGAGAEGLLGGGGDAVAQGAGEGLFFMGGEGAGEAFNGLQLTVPPGGYSGAEGGLGFFDSLLSGAGDAISGAGTAIGGGLSDLFSGLSTAGASLGTAGAAGLTSGINALSNAFVPGANAAELTPGTSGVLGGGGGGAGQGLSDFLKNPDAASGASSPFNEAPGEALSMQALGPPQTFTPGGSTGTGTTPGGGAGDTGDAAEAARARAKLAALNQPTDLNATAGAGDTVDPLLRQQTPGQPQSLAPPGKEAPGFTDAAKAATAGKPQEGSSIWDKIGNVAKIAGPAVAAAGLGYNMYQGSQNKLPATNELGNRALANTATATATGETLQKEGTQLASYINSNTLPPGMEASVKQATDAAIATAKSRMAAQGLSADPTKNSMLADQIEQIQRNAQVQRAQLMQGLAETGGKLVQTGLNATDLTNKVYDSLIKVNQQQSANTGAAIARLAASFNSNPSRIVNA